MRGMPFLIKMPMPKITGTIVTPKDLYWEIREHPIPLLVLSDCNTAYNAPRPTCALHHLIVCTDDNTTRELNSKPKSLHLFAVVDIAERDMILAPKGQQSFKGNKLLGEIAGQIVNKPHGRVPWVDIVPASCQNQSERLKPQWELGFPSIIIKLQPHLRTENLALDSLKHNKMTDLVQLMLDLDSMQADWGDNVVFDYFR